MNIFLLLGSNLGDRKQNFLDAIELLKALNIQVLQQSSIYKTEPWGNTDQPYFINQVLAISTTLAPTQLLKTVLGIELEMGRKRTEKWGPRIIDIDILFYGSTILNDISLILPHPELHLRRFTLEPLNEITPDFIHPVFTKSIKDLLASCSDPGQVSIEATSASL